VTCFVNKRSFPLLREVGKMPETCIKREIAFFIVRNMCEKMNIMQFKNYKNTTKIKKKSIFAEK
jgi:hypothetical protein